MRANSYLSGRAHCNRLRNSRKGELREATKPLPPLSLEVLLCVQLSGFRQCLLVSLEVLIYKLSGNHECNDPEWEGGDYRRPPSSLARVYPLFKMMASNAAQLQKELSGVEQTNALLENIAELCRSGQIDANDLVHRLEASSDYDQLRIWKKLRPRFS